MVWGWPSARLDEYSLGMNLPPLAVVVPAFNEAQRLTDKLLMLLGYLRNYRPKAELIVVDDGSTDGTAQVAEELFARLPDVAARVLRFAENRGKGHAVRAGLLAAQAPIALFSDADLSTPITELPKIVEPVETGNYDIVLGSRALDRSLIGHRQPWRREQGGKVFNVIVRLTTGLPFSDTQCGFKAFRMEAVRPIIEQAEIDGFGFDVELLFLAQRAGLRVLEVPVRWDHYDGSKVHIVHDSLRMFSEVVSLRRRLTREAQRAVSTAGMLS
jgi:glycosyltransferase involved in cell wall biosynthesis